MSLKIFFFIFVLATIEYGLAMTKDERELDAERIRKIVLTNNNIESAAVTIKVPAYGTSRELMSQQDTAIHLINAVTYELDPVMMEWFIGMNRVNPDITLNSAQLALNAFHLGLHLPEIDSIPPVKIWSGSTTTPRVAPLPRISRR